MPEETLLSVKQEMIALKLKAFNSQMNPHFVFNALNAIQYFITSENKRLALEYFSIFSKLIRFYLNHIEKETVHLKDEIAMLQWYLKLQKLRYNNQFEYEIVIEEGSKNIEAAIPSFILQNLFENIIEHTVFNQYKNYSIKTSFNICEKNVCVEVIQKYETNSEKIIDYTPEYRKCMVEWQDQIRLLNKVKKYSIVKNISFKTQADSNSGKILLSLPNLL